MTLFEALLTIRPPDLIRAIDLLGVFSNALLGGVMARAARLDAVGFIVLAILSGMGGGMIRDMLLQKGPVVALTDEWYLICALVAAGLAWLIKMDGPLWDRLFPYVDALALGTWSATGAMKALTFGMDWIPAILLGTITAVGGGFLRDVVLRRIPTVLGGNTLYATAGAFGATVMVLMYELGYWTVGPVVAMLAASGLCLLARWRNWMVPMAYDWAGLRTETERYTRALIRRGRLLREAATRVSIPVRASRPTAADADEADEHSHRARGRSRVRLGGADPVSGAVNRTARGGTGRQVSGQQRSASTAHPPATGHRPRIMRGARKAPTQPPEPQQPSSPPEPS